MAGRVWPSMWRALYWDIIAGQLVDPSAGTICDPQLVTGRKRHFSVLQFPGEDVHEIRSDKLPSPGLVSQKAVPPEG
jgi:hypothetical protein